MEIFKLLKDIITILYTAICTFVPPVSKSLLNFNSQIDELLHPFKNEIEMIAFIALLSILSILIVCRLTLMVLYKLRQNKNTTLKNKTDFK